MKIIKAIELCLWCITHNTHGEYDKFIDFLIDELNYLINRELYLRGYKSNIGLNGDRK